MDKIEICAAIGGFLGIIHALGRLDIIKSWGYTGYAFPSLLLAGLLFFLTSFGADTAKGMMTIGLVSVGSAKLADLLTRSILAPDRPS